jgi:hypothetical protein
MRCPVLFALDRDIDQQSSESPIALGIVEVRPQEGPEACAHEAIQLVGPQILTGTFQQLCAAVHKHRQVRRDQLLELSLEPAASVDIEVEAPKKEPENLTERLDDLPTHNALSLPYRSRMCRGSLSSCSQAWLPMGFRV